MEDLVIEDGPNQGFAVLKSKMCSTGTAGAVTMVAGLQESGKISCKTL